MKCIDRKYTTREIAWDQYNYSYEFEAFESIPTKTDFNFIHVMPNSQVYEDLDNFVVLQVEFPNCLVAGTLDNIDVFKYDHKIKKIITNDPFSVEYFNERFHYDKFIYGFIPYNPRYIPPPQPKIYDVYHTGHMHNSPISWAFPILQQTNACFVCADFGNHRGVGYEEKLLLNAQSKISIVHCLLQWPDRFKQGAAQFPGYRGFDLVQEQSIVPQMKTRVFEAIMSKSLILCLQDPWNVIESYLEPNKDFIYWNGSDDLMEKINHIITHYDDYTPIIESAYAKMTSNFSIRHFFDQYLKEL